ncbi:PepSY domain-containing protein [Shewanella sp. OMA3-2]|uniref:PepSY domain-containing protein n=1 Tax=Shewanella sp. OMA3-2 TaxID=2908650 RepID=UPI001F1784FD|nr:PepSY domain-containing protein [Shewanella sp. OMA3-2]UJF21343.1 PepSY domain-containing protein [Shewanella sp. OMA3-2]
MNLAPLKSVMILVSLWCSLLCFSWPSYAQISPIVLNLVMLQQPGPQNNKQQNLVIRSPQQASSRAQSQFGGKVLRVQPSQVNGHPGYSVKLLSNDGVVFYASVNAVTGAVSRN